MWQKNGPANGTIVAGMTSGKMLFAIFYSNICLIDLPGNAYDQLTNSYGIVLHPTSGALYISDYYNHRLMFYASGTRNGTLLLGGNGAGINNTQLSFHAGLYLDSFSNTLIIANSGAHSIIRYVFGATTWTLVAGNQNGIWGNTSITFTFPLDMTFDPMGNMYVVDRGNHRIQFFSNGGINGITVAGICGVSGSNATTLLYPSAMSFDNQLNLYVADTENHRIQKFLRY